MLFGRLTRATHDQAPAAKPIAGRGVEPGVRAIREVREVREVREDERTLARRDLRHRDAVGLSGLMDDYFALADELEEFPSAESGTRIVCAAPSIRTIENDYRDDGEDGRTDRACARSPRDVSIHPSRSPGRAA